MANRPTIAQQQLFEHVLEEMSTTAITRSALRELTPAQRNKILETRKLQHILIHAQTSEELTSELSTMKWSLINNPRHVLLSSGCADVWSLSPFAWLDPLRPNEICIKTTPPLDNIRQPNLELIWLVHHTIAAKNIEEENLNNFIKHLVAQGVTGDTEVLSVAFGGVERPLKLHDIILAYIQNTKESDWGLITKLTTWKTASEVEDTIFSVFLSMRKMEASESEKILKRLPSLKINWSRKFPVNYFQTPQPHQISLSALVCADCLRAPPRTKNLKNLYLSALEDISFLETNEQNQVIEDILGFTQGFRYQGGLQEFIESSRTLVATLSPSAQKKWTSKLISECIKSRPHQLKHYIDTLLRGLPVGKYFGQEHLQEMYKNVDDFFQFDRYSVSQSKGMDLFRLWKSLRPYMTDQAVGIVDALSSNLLELSSQTEVKEWKTNFNLQVNIKPQLLNQVAKKSARKM